MPKKKLLLCPKCNSINIRPKLFTDEYWDCDNCGDQFIRYNIKEMVVEDGISK